MQIVLGIMRIGMGLGLGLGSGCKRFVVFLSFLFVFMILTGVFVVATVDGYQFHLCVFFTAYHASMLIYLFKYQPITEQ
jgi:hypothetical protein